MYGMKMCSMSGLKVVVGQVRRGATVDGKVSKFEKSLDKGEEIDDCFRK